MCQVFVVLVALCALTYGAHIHLPALKLDGKIVGGEDADIQEVPYQLSLQSGGYHICGASIINANWVLTAAHCVSGASPQSISFRAGSSIKGQGGSIHQAVEITVHPNYDAWNIDFDFAVVKVDTPFPIENTSQIIPLASSEPKDGQTALVSGWGTLWSGGSASSLLQKVEVPIVSRQTCQEKYQQYDITERMICAGVAIGGKDACQGDSGGPLVVGGQLAGIVSWGIGCANKNFPGVYSNVANQENWIREISGV